MPVLIGASARKIIEAASVFIPDGISFGNTIDLEDGTSIPLGPFTLTPFLVDHSAYDAYALLVEADWQHIFYSWDFRSHGRKGKLFDRLIAHPPEKIDVLLMEGATINRKGLEDDYPSESELEATFAELLSKVKGIALLWCSGQNIDRLLTAYRACKRTGRQLIVDMYTANILRAIENPRLPQPGWDSFRVYLPWTHKQKIIKEELFELAESFAPWRIYPERLREEANRSVMLFRPSMMRDLEKANCLKDATLIYAMWPGYLKDERSQPCLRWLDLHNIPVVHMHTSGHAPLSDLKRLARALAPKMLVPAHFFEPERFTEFFENVEIKENGVWWEPLGASPQST